jgi:cold shock CspA family protein/ribosome-associated translation inhibitor RaiA
MQIPLKIAFEDGLDPSDALRARIEREAKKLEQFSSHIIGCRVTVGKLSGRHRQGNLFQVRLQLTLPAGKDIVADRNAAADHTHEDAFVAVRDAFAAARRRLQDRERRMSGQVKVHEPPPEGRVSRIFPEQGYGFIAADDGREIYFHRNAVVNDAFPRLAEGARVRFAETEGDKGPQASTVHVAPERRPPPGTAATA